MPKLAWSNAVPLGQKVFSDFYRFRVGRLSAALAFFAFFAFPAIVVVFITSLGKIYGRQEVQGHIFTYLKNFVGEAAFAKVVDLVKQFQVADNTGGVASFGLIALILSATGVLIEMQDALNFIFDNGRNKVLNFARIASNYIIGLLVLLCVALALLLSVIATKYIGLMGAGIAWFSPTLASVIVTTLNYLVLLCEGVLIFYIIYQLLPEVKYHWYDVLQCALVTSVFFFIGRIGFEIYLKTNTTMSAFTAAGSLIVFLLWIYYSALVLYLGALLLKSFGKPVRISIISNKEPLPDQPARHQTIPTASKNYRKR